MGDHRTDIEFEAVSDSSPTSTRDNLDEDGPGDSRAPLTGDEKVEGVGFPAKNAFKVPA